MSYERCEIFRLHPPFLPSPYPGLLLPFRKGEWFLSDRAVNPVGTPREPVVVVGEEDTWFPTPTSGATDSGRGMASDVEEEEHKHVTRMGMKGDVLVVAVKRAELDAERGDCDVYAKVKAGTELKARTEGCRDSAQSPTWNTTFAFPVEYLEQNDVLQVSLWDANHFWKHKHLGTVDVPLKNLGLRNASGRDFQAQEVRTTSIRSSPSTSNRDETPTHTTDRARRILQEEAREYTLLNRKRGRCSCFVMGKQARAVCGKVSIVACFVQEGSSVLDGTVNADVRNSSARKKIGTSAATQIHTQPSLCFLRVKVLEARDLIAADFGGTSDPYAVVRVEDPRSKKYDFDLDKNHRTKVNRRTLRPTWNKEFLMAAMLPIIDKQALVIQVFDHDKYSMDDYLGQISIPLKTLQAYQEQHPKEAATSHQHGRKSGVWYALSKSGDNGANCHSSMLVDVPAQASMLYVKVISGRRLPPKDFLTGTSDPYVIVTAPLKNGGAASIRSKIVSSNLNPEWGEVFAFPLATIDHTVCSAVNLEVWDYDMLSPDEFMGLAQVPFDDVDFHETGESRPKERWLTLSQDRNGTCSYRRRSQEQAWDRAGHAGALKVSIWYGTKRDPALSLASRAVTSQVGNPLGQIRIDASIEYGYFEQVLPKVGKLKLGLLQAHNLTAVHWSGTPSVYAVVKYEKNWARIRTILSTTDPVWNEELEFDVHDPSSVLTIGLFEDFHLENNILKRGIMRQRKDHPMGKFRIRVSTLDGNRLYRVRFPLLLPHKKVLRKVGELEVELKFEFDSVAKVIWNSLKPPLPAIHYTNPMEKPALAEKTMREAMIAYLAQERPPVHQECVEELLDARGSIFRMRRAKVNYARLLGTVQFLIDIVKAACTICEWKYASLSVLAHVVFIFFVYNSHLLVPTLCALLLFKVLWHYRGRGGEFHIPPMVTLDRAKQFVGLDVLHEPREVPHADAGAATNGHEGPVSDADTSFSDAELNEDELFDAGSSVSREDEGEEMKSGNPVVELQKKLEELRTLAARVQNLMGTIAEPGERVHNLLRWEDPRSTAVFTAFLLVSTVLTWTVDMRHILVIVGVVLMRHPILRSPTPPPPVSMFLRLPTNQDLLL